MATNDLPQGERVLATRIPEHRRVAGLEYGRHVSTPGWSGYYVKLPEQPVWAVARLTPAEDELAGDDAAILAAIREELDALTPEPAARPEPYRFAHGSLYQYRPERRAYVHVLKTTAKTKARAIAEFEAGND